MTSTPPSQPPPPTRQGRYRYNWGQAQITRFRFLVGLLIVVTPTATHALSQPVRSATSTLVRRNNLGSVGHACQPTLPCVPLTSRQRNDTPDETLDVHRRDLLRTVALTMNLVLLAHPSHARALPSLIDGTNFTRETSQYAYTFTPPPSFDGPSQKPLKTHLDEVNFSSLDVPGYQFGITIDPVRIVSLVDFGTPEQVAAKVILAEVARDGVFTVKLVEDPVAKRTSTNDVFYQLDYISSGKRGDKHFIAKFFIQNQKLYALTAQCKEETYPRVQHSMLEAVDSFRVLS